MAVVDQDALAFWEAWWRKWHRRIVCLDGHRTGGRCVRAVDVSTAWIRLVMPAVEPEYVMPDWWRALAPEEKRSAPRPQPELRHRSVPPASERSQGFSLDDVGPYYKAADGVVYRDRRSASHRMWRYLPHVPELRRAIDWLPARAGRAGRTVRGRTPSSLLDALVCLSLVEAGLSQVRAAEMVMAWDDNFGDPKKLADRNRVIWRELRLPVSE